MFTALQALAENTRSLLEQGGVMSVLITCLLIAAWVLIVAVLLGAFAHSSKTKRIVLATIAGIALVCMLALAEFSLFAFGAMLGGDSTEEQPV